LISVTNFFRDKNQFEFLETDVIPRLFAGKGVDDQVRIWCVGCATGEEAYSIAMLCAEYSTGVIDAPTVQIFATDIDEPAIAIARDGLYSLNDAADVSPERLRRFFTKEGAEYRIRREIREMVLFANHNVIKDPPFSHLSLATCRNLLIYLNHPAKERVMETLHFALDPGGFLFLGTSESVDGAGDLYAAVSRENHIYQSRQTGFRPYPVPEAVPPFRFERTAPPGQDQERRALERITFGDLHQRLLEQYAPPSVVVNEDYEIVHLSEQAGRYMHVPGGDASKNLLKLVLPELRLELRSALYQAVQRKTNVEAAGVKVKVGNETQTLNIHVRPVLDTEDTSRGFLLVVFEPTTALTRTEEEPVFRSDEPIAQQLEEELARSKAQLRSSSEQYEIQAEELKASNEELQAMNEELRSAAEELETSKEELQSINEELRTVNQELKVKVEETTIASNNLHNLINSTDIGTVFLDRSLRVQLFTPSARSLFNLIPADNGRPLSDITHRLDYTHLSQDAELVLEKLHTLEREVRSVDGRHFLMRIVPYRTAEDRINGVVVALLDITARKQAEAELSQTEERMRLIVESATDYAIFTADMARNVDSWNSGAEAMFGYTEQEIIGRSVDILFTPEDRADGVPEREAERSFSTGRAENERWHSRKDGSRFYGSGLSMPLRDDSGKDIGLVKIMRDLTREKQAQEELERFNRVAVGRETRMIDLKREVNELTARLGEQPRYDLAFERGENGE
ncbi:MAG TPA: CheR family methyltransferase, partial [Pyrinomonadaceae bacterium]|nr:CheR family methyltransferase [Pyrinomonadaceae bacterium]